MLIRDHHFFGGIQLAYPRGSLGIHLRVDWVCCGVSAWISEREDPCLPRTPGMLEYVANGHAVLRIDCQHPTYKCFLES